MKTARSISTTVAYNARPTPIKHIWFLPSLKEAIAIKPKELDFKPMLKEKTIKKIHTNKLIKNNEKKRE